MLISGIMSIGIITDSACDLPSEVLLQHNIISVPLQVIINGEAQRDWLDIAPAQLYQRMLVDGIMPETSPPSIDDLLMCYETALERHDKVIAVHVSHQLSETYLRAQQAINTLEAQDRVLMIDSQHINAAVAEILLALAESIARGEGDIHVLAQEAIHIRDTAHSLYVPHSLKWLVAGGRLSPVRAAVGNMLNIRPFISITNGVVVNEGTARKHKVMDSLIERLEGYFADRPIRLTFTSAGVQSEALEEFQHRLAESYLNIANARLQMIGPAIGAHLGPHTIGATAYPVEDEILF